MGKSGGTQKRFKRGRFVSQQGSLYTVSFDAQAGFVLRTSAAFLDRCTS